MAKVYLIEGPVGAGKSTFAAQLSREISAPHLNLDAWMSRLYRPDRPGTGLMEWYAERKNRCIEQILDVAQKLLDANCDVILELGLIQRESRRIVFGCIEEFGCDIKVYALEAAREVRRERVQRRNLEQGSTFAMEVSDEIFEIASDMWEELEESELGKHDIEFVSTVAASEFIKRKC